MNEPTKAVEGYGGNMTGSGYAPNVSAPGVGPYLAGHVLLKAHAAAYHLYNKKYRESQKGKHSPTNMTKCQSLHFSSWLGENSSVGL